MSKPKGGLGRGLGSLIQSAPLAPAFAVSRSDVRAEEGKRAPSTMVRMVATGAIVENPHQPRTEFSQSAIEDLMESIKLHGILQPLVVTELGDGKYELIAGERRLRSARGLALAEVPVIVRTANDQEKLELALIENIQRQDLNAIEEARAYQALMDTFHLSHDAIAARVGKSRSHVANTLRLMDLDPVMQQALVDEKISKSHARTLLAEPDHAARETLFRTMLAGGMTVRQAEVRAGAATRKPKPGKDANIAAIEAELRDVLGTKVTIELVGTSGKMTIYFYSKEDLKELVRRLT